MDVPVRWEVWTKNGFIPSYRHVGEKELLAEHLSEEGFADEGESMGEIPIITFRVMIPSNEDTLGETLSSFHVGFDMFGIVPDAKISAMDEHIPMRSGDIF
jgi:hypothetical protein